MVVRVITLATGLVITIDFYSVLFCGRFFLSQCKIYCVYYKIFEIVSKSIQTNKQRERKREASGIAFFNIGSP